MLPPKVKLLGLRQERCLWGVYNNRGGCGFWELKIKTAIDMKLRMRGAEGEVNLKLEAKGHVVGVHIPHFMFIPGQGGENTGMAGNLNVGTGDLVPTL
jgi:hypothetical protein